MQELLVLGIIPGTNIQITFGLWLTVIYLVSIFVFSIVLMRGNHIRNTVITLGLMLQTRQMTRLPA